MKRFFSLLLLVGLMLAALCLPAAPAAEGEEDYEEEYEPQNTFDWGDPEYFEFLSAYAEDRERYGLDGYRQLVEMYDPREPIPFKDMRAARTDSSTDDFGARGYLSVDGQVIVDPVWFNTTRFEGHYGLATKNGAKLVYDREGHLRMDASEVLFDALWTNKNQYFYIVRHGPNRLIKSLYDEDLFKVADNVESWCSGYYVVRNGPASEVYDYDHQLVYRNGVEGDFLQPFLNMVDGEYYLVERQLLTVVIRTLPGGREIARYDRASFSVNAEDCAVAVTSVDDYHNAVLVVLDHGRAMPLRLRGSGFNRSMQDPDRIRIDYRAYTSSREPEKEAWLVYDFRKDIAFQPENELIWLGSIMTSSEIGEYSRAKVAGLPTIDLPVTGHEDYDYCVGLDYSFSGRLRAFNRTVYHCYLRGDEDIGGYDVLLRDLYTGAEFAFDNVICTYGPTAFFQICEHYCWDCSTLLFEKDDGSWTIFDLVNQGSLDCPSTYVLESAGRNYILFYETDPADGQLIRHLYTVKGWSADFSAPILFPPVLSFDGVRPPDRALLHTTRTTISMTSGHVDTVPLKATAYPVSIAGDSALDWVNAYANFLKGYRFLVDDYGQSMVNGYYFQPVTPDNILTVGEYSRPFEVSLYDMDRDGVPELFIDTGGDFAFGSVFVYTYSRAAVRFAGIIDYHEERDLSFHISPAHTGLLGGFYGMGVSTFTYYDLDNGRLRRQVMYDEYDMDEEGFRASPDGPVIEWVTDLQEMRDLVMSINWHQLRFETLESAVRGSFYDHVVKPVARDTAYELVKSVPDTDSVQGYSYAANQPDDWVATQMWLSLAQLNISGMDSRKARRQLYFEFALKACGTTKQASYIKADAVPEIMKDLKDFNGFTVDFFYHAVAKITPQDMIISWNGANEDAIKKAMKEYFESDDMSEMALRARLDELQLFTPKQQEPIFRNLETLRLLKAYGDALKIYEYSEKTINEALEVVNQWNLLNAVDQDQLLEIADSFSSRGDEDMKHVGNKIRLYLNSSRTGQLVLLATDHFGDLCFDLLFKKFKSTILKNAGGMRGAVFTLIYMTIDNLTNVGDLTGCNIEIVAAADNMRQFYNDYYNRVGFYETEKSAHRFRRMMFSCLNFYEAAIKVNDVYRDLVKTGDQAILSGLINNDAMRAAADKAAVDNERYQAFLCYLRQLMDLYFDD